MSDLTIRALTPDTFDDFAALVERNGGMFAHCWCTWFHPDCVEKEERSTRRALKQRLVADGIAHAALVFDGDQAVAWAEYGSPEELPNIHHRKEYLAAAERLPDYRVTCILVERGLRGQGLAAVALRGALQLIAQAGGGRVEGYPHDTGGVRKKNSSFLYTARARCTSVKASRTTGPRARATASWCARWFRARSVRVARADSAPARGLSRRVPRRRARRA